MKTFRLLIISFLSLLIVAGCAKIKDLFDDTEENRNISVNSEDKELLGNSVSKTDKKFYNKYIEVINRLSPSVDEVQKYYLTNVPEPSSVTKNSMIYVIAADVYLNILERNYKELKRSLLEKGELSTLEAENEEMKTEIETRFKDVLSATEKYIKNAQLVIEFYKNNEYKKDLTNVKPYDELMKTGYQDYKDRLYKFTEILNKYKPSRIKRNPEDYSNPDEKAVAVLQNTLESTIDEAELIYSKLERFDQKSETGPLVKDLEEFEENFRKRKNEVLSAPFTEKSLYLKFSFEDYFSKTVADFIKNTLKFLENAEKYNENDFNREYDYTVNYYNYMIQAYNSTINNADSFIVY